MDKFDDPRVDVNALREQIAATRKLLDRAIYEYEQAMLAIFRYRPGDTLRAADGSLAKVTSLAFRLGEVSFVLSPQRKDGSWSARTIPGRSSKWWNAPVIAE